MTFSAQTPGKQPNKLGAGQGFTYAVAMWMRKKENKRQKHQPKMDKKKKERFRLYRLYEGDRNYAY